MRWWKDGEGMTGGGGRMRWRKDGEGMAGEEVERRWRGVGVGRSGGDLVIWGRMVIFAKQEALLDALQEDLAVAGKGEKIDRV